MNSLPPPPATSSWPPVAPPTAGPPAAANSASVASPDAGVAIAGRSLSAPVDYVGLTRPGRRWWRLPLSLALFAAVYVVQVLTLTVVFVVVGLLAGWPLNWFVAGFTEPEGMRMTPGALLYVNLSLAALIPATVLSTRLAQGIRPGYVHSVAGRFRWGLFGRLLLVILPVWLVFVLGVSALAGGLFTRPEPHPELWGFLAVIWLTTALQCAGEEYAFRGWLLQNVGGLIGMRVLAWVLPVVMSAILFGLAHGSLDVWVLGSLMIFAAAAAVLTWRSGGLEAAVALHTLNNMLVMHVTLVMGGFDASFIGTDTSGTFPDLVAGLLGHAVVVALVWWWLKRRGVRNTTTVDPRIPRRIRRGRVAAPQPINSA